MGPNQNSRIAYASFMFRFENTIKKNAQESLAFFCL
jgi:hypothetical protein